MSTVCKDCKHFVVGPYYIKPKWYNLYCKAPISFHDEENHVTGEKGNRVYLAGRHGSVTTILDDEDNPNGCPHCREINYQGNCEWYR